MHKVYYVAIFIFFLVISSIASTGSGVSKVGPLTAMPPQAPELSSPSDGRTFFSDSVTFVWNALPHAFGFQLEVATDSVFDKIPILEAIDNDTIVTLNELTDNTLYYWRVRAMNAAGYGDYSLVRDFTTCYIKPNAPSLCYPQNGEGNIGDQVELGWHRLNDVDSYHLQLSDHNDFSHLTVDEYSLADTLYSVSVATDKKWYWRVCGSNSAGEGVYSEIWSFDTFTQNRVDDLDIPTEFALLPAYPNPFNPVTTLTLCVPVTSATRLIVYNSLGQRVRTLVDGTLGAGRYTLQWDSCDDHGLPVPSGMYLCRFIGDGRVFTRKMLLLR